MQFFSGNSNGSLELFFRKFKHLTGAVSVVFKQTDRIVTGLDQNGTYGIVKTVFMRPGIIDISSKRIPAGDHRYDRGCSGEQRIKFDTQFFPNRFSRSNDHIVSTPIGTQAADLLKQSTVKSPFDLRIGNVMTAAAGSIGIVFVKITEMTGQTITLTGPHFSGTATVFDGGLHNDLLVNMLRDRQIKVKIKVFAPGTAPEIFIGITIDFVFDLHFVPAIDFF